MILHYSLAIWKINDNALSLIFFVNAQRSEVHSSTPPYSVYTFLYHECDSDTRIIDLIACTKIVFT